jgi:hypothetical protein
MLPWVTAVVLLVFPIAVADFDYRYLLPVLPFACQAAALAFAPARTRVAREPDASLPADQLTTHGGPAGHLGAPRPESAVAPGTDRAG